MADRFLVHIVKCITANKEYSWQVPLGTKSLTIQCGSSKEIRIASARGKVEGSTPQDYYYLKENVRLRFSGLNVGNDIFLYFASEHGDKEVQIACWYREKEEVSAE